MRPPLSHHIAWGAETHVALYDLGVFVDQAAGPVPSQNAHTGHFGRLR
jgi:hypothetical protein